MRTETPDHRRFHHARQAGLCKRDFDPGVPAPPYASPVRWQRMQLSARSSRTIAKCRLHEVEGEAEKQARYEDLRLGMKRVSEILAPRLEMRLLLRTLLRLYGPLV